MSTPDIPPPKPKKPRYRATVKSVVDLSPRMRRVTFAGDALADFLWSGPASHIKLIFNADAAPDERPVLRTYTPRRFDPATRELDVDFVLHGEGPASHWAEQAAVGQTLLIAGPGRAYAVDASADWYLLAGDESALPALGTILEALPAGRPVQLYLEVADLAESAALAAVDAATQLHWLPRPPGSHAAGQALETALRAAVLPSGSGRIYVACESDAMRRIRRHLLTERGLAAAQLVTRGYWKQGATDHPDRDYGEDA
jgi:NADPH-dependent ferric siderophore reductase